MTHNSSLVKMCGNTSHRNGINARNGMGNPGVFVSGSNLIFPEH